MAHPRLYLGEDTDQWETISMNPALGVPISSRHQWVFHPVSVIKPELNQRTDLSIYLGGDTHRWETKPMTSQVLIVWIFLVEDISWRNHSNGIPDVQSVVGIRMSSSSLYYKASVMFNKWLCASTLEKAHMVRNHTNDSPGIHSVLGIKGSFSQSESSNQSNVEKLILQIPWWR